MDYVIAIPTYKRPQLKTIEYIEREKIPVNLITIFVANADEYAIYSNVWGHKYKIVIGAIGIGSQRNFITAYYPTGTYVVSMDDDIRDLYHMEGVGFNTWIQECLLYMKNRDIGLLGLNPTTNVYWRTLSQAPKFQSGKYLAVGVFHIYQINAFIEPLTFDFVEDYERSIKYLHLDGAVARYNGVVLKHTGWSCGGLKEARTKEAYCDAVVRFASLYTSDIYLTYKKIPALSKIELLPNVRIKR